MTRDDLLGGQAQIRPVRERATRSVGDELCNPFGDMIVLHVAMSLDGFIAGPGHDMSWTNGAEYDTSSALADQIAKATGAILAGRGWYDVAKNDPGGAVAGIYGGTWTGPVVVVTHDPTRLHAEAGIELATDVEVGLARAEQLAEGRDVGIFGGDIARQVLALGRLDEIVAQIVPIVLGGGVPLFGKGPGRRVALERVYLGSSGVLSDMRFRVLGGMSTGGNS
jgi:dihydrofolate reductase